MLKTIKESSSAEIEIKKSRFIANLYPIANKEEAEGIIEETKKRYFDARHNCYAYRVSELTSIKNNINTVYEKASDDGEPSGTAGSPMLDILKKNSLQNILIIVTRYFGGTLLGTGGLVKAYSDVTKKALECNKIIKQEYGLKYKININYDNLKNILYFCKKYNINVINTIYNEQVELILESNSENKEKIQVDANLKNITVLENEILIEIK